MPSLQTGVSNFAELEQLAIESGAPYLATEVRDLAEQIRDGLFYVACIGQFKRGKSTLLNALVGRSMLPTGVVPVTAVVTVIRYGQEQRVRVRLSGGTWRDIPPDEIADYVSEIENHENEKSVTAVEVFTPSPLLATGMCLVDTPGIGSVFVGNTEATKAFVPHVDAALVVLGADPPISADELALITEISKQCRNLVFVLNKADKFTDAERKDAVEFTRRVMAEHAGIAHVQIFEVSATDRLAGQGPTRDWTRLIDALDILIRQSGSELVRQREERGLMFIAERLQRRLREEREALLHPVEESEQRAAMLRVCVADAERSLNDFGYLFTAEQDRLSRIFAGKKDEFLVRAVPGAQRELAAALRAAGIRRGSVLRNEAIKSAQEISKKWLDNWLAKARPAAELLYVEATRRFIDLANDFLNRLLRTNHSALAGLPQAVDAVAGFTARSGLYYTFLMTLTSQTPVGWIMDRLRSRVRQLRVLEDQVGDYLERLIITNANRIANDFDDRVLESRRKLELGIRVILKEIVSAAEHALANARERRTQGEQAVREELQRIDMRISRLKSLRSE